MRTPTDVELLHSGEPEAFGVFYDRHHAVVLAYLSRRLGRADLTIDLAAEVFARALEHRYAYEPSRGPAVGWLLTIARNLLIDTVRRGQVADATRRRLSMEPVELDDAGLRRVEGAGAVDLPRALADLPADVRDTVIARIVQEEPYAVLAQRIGVSEQVVRKRVSRGLAALRRALER